MHDGESDLQRAADMLRQSQEIVVFTGAGVSAESGIPTFRAEDGLWRYFPPEEFATWHGLLRNLLLRPRRAAEFAAAVIGPVAEAVPNPAHRAIAELERHARVTVVTQNIDRLHQEAGSSLVHEVHGSLFEIVSGRGQTVRSLSRDQLRNLSLSLRRLAGGRLVLPRLLGALRPLLGVGMRGLHRPHVVLFGEGMAEPAWSRALEAAAGCDCLLEIGCSREVWPAAMLPEQARDAGAPIIVVDPEPAGGDIRLSGQAASLVPRLVETAYGPRSP